MTTQTVGIIGVGHLIRHMMPALVSAPADFLLSPRGEATAADLSHRFGLTVAGNNQEIVDTSPTVILAVRPYDALAVASGLNWRQGQTVLSLCAGIATADLAPAVSPASLVMAMPVVAAEFGESPTLLFPEDARCRALLETCGPVIAVADETDFTPSAAIACYYGWVQELINQMITWLIDRGVGEHIARPLVAQMTRAAATTIRERPDASVTELVAELATPRSFTLKGLDVLRAGHAFTPWHDAAAAVAPSNPEK